MKKLLLVCVLIGLCACSQRTIVSSIDVGKTITSNIIPAGLYHRRDRTSVQTTDGFLLFVVAGRFL